MLHTISIFTINMKVRNAAYSFAQISGCYYQINVPDQINDAVVCDQVKLCVLCVDCQP